ncbi:protein of unknown function (plasmid) [Caballeronia sp. S22]
MQLTGWLSAQQLALTQATITLEHERGRQAIEPTVIDIALAEPTWHEEHLVRLLKERLGRVELEAAVIALRLTASKVQPAEPPSDSLFPDPGGSAQDHNRLLELLVARLGAENVLRPAPTSDHRPELANQWVPVQDTTKACTAPAELPRPTWLLDAPVRLMIKNHRPFYGSPLKLVSTGERIEAGWHDGELVTRDYYVAEATDKSCYWIYRERPSVKTEEVRWFLPFRSCTARRTGKSSCCARCNSATRVWRSPTSARLRVVRAHVQAKEEKLPLIIGSYFRLVHADKSPAFGLILLAQNRNGYGKLSELITLGRMRAAKGTYLLTPHDPSKPFNGSITRKICCDASKSRGSILRTRSS